ncbi:procathepsin L-like [Centropristis striata]|uniref:procathepsin L-like n=1 Tax=Centropristis striata TaxID=184440 RepID=UPI0027DFE093|nr:procathepsin L-like [Centropristis striata]
MLCAVLLWAGLVLGHSAPTVTELWEKWQMKHGKVYDDQMEVAYRRAVWEKNVRLVLRHNKEASAGLHSFTMGLNHLADMTAEEVNEKLNGLKMEEPTRVRNYTFKDLSGQKMPKSVDWRKNGMVGPVRNQGMCGSCWAFSTMGALEAQMRRQTGALVTLSPQNLVDCSASNHGCRGGYLSAAFRYVIRNQGVDSENFYPYETRDGPCRYSVEGMAGYCSDFHDVPPGNERALQAAVATVGPISVAVNAMLQSFHFYKGGLYNEPNCDPNHRNHAVLLVGYGSEDGQDFWIVKNSWGVEWGEGGYIRIVRNRNNLCGIASNAVYPSV